MSQDLEAELRQVKLLLEQEKGKRIAVERQNYEIQRQAKATEAQAEALKAETDAALLEGAEQMKIALAVSQGIWALAHMGRAYLARKVAAGRIVHREQNLTLLMSQMMDAFNGKDATALQAVSERAKSVIETIKKDGEASRIAAAEASLSYGVREFEKVFDKLIQDNNPLLSYGDVK
jgi:hypothetical protein